MRHTFPVFISNPIICPTLSIANPPKFDVAVTLLLSEMQIPVFAVKSTTPKILSIPEYNNNFPEFTKYPNHILCTSISSRSYRIYKCLSKCSTTSS